MTVVDFERVALLLSNAMWCRHWKHWNYPQTPRVFAVQAFDFDNGALTSQKIPDLVSKGFREHVADGRIVYLVDETAE